MKHTNKLKKARKMMTPEEISNHVPVFDSAEWKKMKEAKLLKRAMSILGKRSGALKPKEHFKMMNQKSIEARRKIKETNELNTK